MTITVIRINVYMLVIPEYRLNIVAKTTLTNPPAAAAEKKSAWPENFLLPKYIRRVNIIQINNSIIGTKKGSWVDM
jgi:hypothetical protein